MLSYQFHIVTPIVLAASVMQSDIVPSQPPWPVPAVSFFTLMVAFALATRVVQPALVLWSQYQPAIATWVALVWHADWKFPTTALQQDVSRWMSLALSSSREISDEFESPDLEDGAITQRPEDVITRRRIGSLAAA